MKIFTIPGCYIDKFSPCNSGNKKEAELGRRRDCDDNRKQRRKRGISCLKNVPFPESDRQISSEGEEAEVWSLHSRGWTSSCCCCRCYVSVCVCCCLQHHEADWFARSAFFLFFCKSRERTNERMNAYSQAMLV